MFRRWRPRILRAAPRRFQSDRRSGRRVHCRLSTRPGRRPGSREVVRRASLRHRLGVRQRPTVHAGELRLTEWPKIPSSAGDTLNDRSKAPNGNALCDRAPVAGRDAESKVAEDSIFGRGYAERSIKAPNGNALWLKPHVIENTIRRLWRGGWLEE